MSTIKQMGRLAAAPPSLMDPERFKPESVGQRAFNPRARGSTPPGSSNHKVICTRLAQSVELRPLTSEVRGSIPRSCTNPPLRPATHLSRRTRCLRVETG